MTATTVADASTTPQEGIRQAMARCSAPDDAALARVLGLLTDEGARVRTGCGLPTEANALALWGAVWEEVQRQAWGTVLSAGGIGSGGVGAVPPVAVAEYRHCTCPVGWHGHAQEYREDCPAHGGAVREAKEFQRRG